ncbi:acyltransferase family protein [Marinobacter sp.]|uniref:acyltransferase family protein n=1 Tax=Marinobacter sp. TaxID=50741 RepID=UPI003A8EA0AC
MPKKLTYLPQLDGLRALAVVAVIIFHSRTEWLSGGFVGVDVFFVLSGFLITQMVVGSLEAGKFSYVNFIAGRVRRLFPAYLVMVGACLLVAPIILLPAEFERLAETALASLIFLSNAFFYSNLGYFDAAAEQQILLHTWSLAVEWQFYLVFPAVLWLAFRFTGRVLATLLILGVASLVLNLMLTPQDAKFTFFMFPPRAWELIAGGLLGLAYMKGAFQGKENLALTLVGLVLLGVSFVAFDKSTLFPGFAALLPVLATVLLVYNITQAEAGLLTSLLSWRPFLLIGKMSYSLYLWHWPILLFARFYYSDELSIAQLVLCWTATGLLSYASWRWVESRLRGHRWLSGKWRAYAGAVALSMPIAVTAGMVMVNDGYESRLPAEAHRLITIEKWPDFGNCVTKYERDLYYNCILGATDKPATALVWGDSHAQTLIWALNRIVERRGVAIRHVTKGGCPPIFFGVPESTNIDKKACIASQKSVSEIIESDPAITTVFIAARWPLYQSADLALIEDQVNSSFGNALAATIRKLLERGLKVVVVDSLPEPGFDVANSLARRALIGQKSIDSFVDAALPFQSLVALDDVKNPNLRLVRLNAALCSNGKCPLWESGELRYFDHDHLAKAGAQILTDDIEKAIVLSEQLEDIRGGVVTSKW